MRTRAAAPARPPAADERTWAAVPDPAPGATEPIYVSFPAPPDAEALTEAATQLAALEARRQISREGGASPPGATHAIERDAVGHRRLVRKRFARR
jgi:hypothetical protein